MFLIKDGLIEKYFENYRTDKIGDCAKQKYERFDVSKDLDKSFKLMFFNKS